MNSIYLDYAATTPLAERVLEAMLPYLREVHANPSSLHAPGRLARRGVEKAREQVAAAIGAKAKEIIFTSGATEADNMALRAVAAQHPGKHILTSSVEHAAVLATARALETQGHPVTYLAPDKRGAITPDAVAEALRDDTALVALMAVNNETGVKTDVAAVGEIVGERGVPFFCDAVQAFGFQPLDVKALNVDMLSLSAHKVYGSKGAGVLYMREGLELPPLLYGGEQERGLRAGTHNVPAIVGMGKAAELAVERLPEVEELAGRRNNFEAKLLRLDSVSSNGARAPRGPKHCNVQVRGVDGEALLMNLDALGVYASAGSACAAGSLEPSHVLTAMGLTDEAAKASVRFSLGYEVTDSQLEEAAERFVEAVSRCRAFAEV